MGRVRVHLICLLVCAAAAGAQTTNWIGGTGLWSNSANWDNGIPSAPGINAVINQAGADVTLDSSLPGPTIDTLQLATGNLTITASTLTLNAPTPASNPLTLGANTNLGITDTSGAAQLAFSLTGNNNIYSATGTVTSAINITGGTAQMVIDGVGTGNLLSLTGSGILNLVNGGAIVGTNNGSTFTTDFNIHGGGVIQNLTVNYSGALDTLNGGLTITPAGSFTNAGSLTATSGILTLYASQGGVFVNGNTIEALSSDIHVTGISGNVSSPALINNGTINVDSGNLFRVTAPDATPQFIQNNGTISLNGSDLDGLVTIFEVRGTGIDNNIFSLNGTGTLNLSDSRFNLIDGFFANETLINESTHTIQGSGTIGALSLINNGAIIANGANNSLILSGNDPSIDPTLIGVLNNGVINVTGSAANTLLVDTSFGAFRNSAPGSIAVGAGSTLTFASKAGGEIINDGVITNNGQLALDSYGGVFNLNGAGTLHLDGAFSGGQTGSEILVNGPSHTILLSNGGALGVRTINNGLVQTDFTGGQVQNTLVNNGVMTGSFTFDPGAKLVNNGLVNATSGIEFAFFGSTTIVNNGTIAVSGGDVFMAIPGAGSATLDGWGTLNLGTNNLTASGALSLTIGAGQTVTGGGGIIAATVTNNGNLVATGAGPLTIAALTNYDSGTQTLTGGSYTADGKAMIIQNLGPIQTIAAGTTVTLNGGAAATLTPDGVTDAMTALSSLQGTLELAGGHNLTLDNSTGTFSNGGTLIVGAGSTFDASSRQFLSLDTGGALTGNYNVAGTFQYTPQSGSDGFIRTIPVGTSVVVNGGLITFDGSTNALTQLATNAGSLALLNTSLTLSGVSNYCNCGSLSLFDATFDTRAATFGEFSGGHLTAGSYAIGGNSTFFFTPGGGGSGDITTIDAGVSVTLNGTGRIAYGSGVGTDALTHLSDNEGSFTLNGGRSLTLDPSVATFTNNGTLTVAPGSTFDTNNAAFLNVNGGNLTGNYAIGGHFNYTPQAGETGITSIDANASLALNIGGTITYAGNDALANLAVNNGILALNGTNLSVANPFTNNGAMSVTDGAIFAAAGPLVNSGSLTVSNSGQITTPGYQGFAGSTLTVNAGATADFTGGVFANVDGANTLVNGNFVIGGQLKFDNAPDNIQFIGTSASLTLSGNGQILSGAGNALAQLQENDGNLTLINGATLNLLNNGTGFFGNDSPGGPGTAQLTLSGMGTSLVTGGFGNAGTVNMDQGATLHAMDIAINLGAINIDGPNTKLSADGLLMISGASLTLTNGAVADFRSELIPLFGATDTFFNLQPGGLLTEGNYFIGGIFLFDPNSDPAGGNILTIDTGTSLTLAGNGKMLYGAFDGANALEKIAENDGSLAVIQGASINTSSDFVNTGNLIVATGGLFGTSATMVNDGTVNVDQLSTIFTGGGYTQEAGSTQIDGLLGGGATVTGGLLKGTGTIAGNLTVNGGTVKPGDSPGELTVTGDVTLNPASHLLIEFAGRDTPGADWSVLIVGGTATLSGFIDVALLNAINFQAGDLFTILTAGTSVIDNGVQFNLPSLGNGLFFAPIFTPNALELQVEAFAAAPEPATWALMLGAALAGIGLRKRRQR